MSRSITTVVTATVREQLQQVAKGSARSHLLTDLAQPSLQSSAGAALRQGPPEIGRLASRTEALGKRAGLEAAVAATAPVQLAEAKRLLDDCERKLAQNNASGAAALAQQGDSKLREALLQTASVLAKVERTDAASVVERSLASMGCRVMLREGGGATGISAERGHQRIVALVADGGLTVFDIAGCGEDACEPLHAELAQEVAKHGGAMEDVEVELHGDYRGGALIRGAALAAGGDSLADGAVRYAEARRHARFSRSREAQALASEQVPLGH